MGIFSNPARDEQGNELKRRRTDQVPFSIIASDMTVVGDLETEGVVRIEGRVKGAVRVGSQILVTQGAVIEGDLHTQGRSSPARSMGPSMPATGWNSRRPGW
jgi:hypothetical protein